MSEELKPRRNYDREFKIQAFKLLSESEKTTPIKCLQGVEVGGKWLLLTDIHI